jgi:hypothetical protein
MPPVTSTRLFTRGIDVATLEARITRGGDQALGRHLLGAVAINHLDAGGHDPVPAGVHRG